MTYARASLVRKAAHHRQMIKQINRKYRDLRKKRAPKEALRKASRQRKQHEHWLKEAEEKLESPVVLTFTLPPPETEVESIVSKYVQKYL